MLKFWRSLAPLGKWIAAAITAVLVVWALLFVRDWVIGTNKIEARLGTEQSGAAIESGKDAVNTVGDNQRRADETDSKVTGVQNNVDDAKDGAAADRAARDGLCQQFGVCDEK